MDRHDERHLCRRNQIHLNRRRLGIGEMQEFESNILQQGNAAGQGVVALLYDYLHSVLDSSEVFMV